MDPGNFATNIEAGARFGYALLWVVLLANLTAMLFQSLSAKVGIVTGKSLAQHCGERLPKPLVYAMWGASEVAAMATDLAEFLGAALGLSLLTGWPLMTCLMLTGIITYALLLVQNMGFRPMEVLIGVFVFVIGACYLIEIVIAPPDWRALAGGLFVPTLPDARAVTLAVGIIGATVMPQAESRGRAGRRPARPCRPPAVPASRCRDGAPPIRPADADDREEGRRAGRARPPRAGATAQRSLPRGGPPAKAATTTRRGEGGR
jgi:hypothetical protein